MIENFQDLQTRSQAERFRILKLLNALLLNNRLALKEMGDESLIAITDLVSGEKDPRNLMIVFSVLRVIMIEWDISSHPEVAYSMLIHALVC